MKVFGTGWQRTGTTSLARALSVLGLRTKDYPKELLYDLDHEILRQFEAFTDNPIPILYQQLDARHPGSRFVHTVRAEQDWLRSVEWLFTLGRVKFHWKDRPIVHEIHERLYGTTEFDPVLFLERYQRHNREVREYFAQRPEDCLVLDITKGEGFEKLGPFLGKQVPSRGFPHSNPTESGLKVKLRNLVDRFRK